MVYGTRELHVRPVGTKTIIRFRAPDLSTLKQWALAIYLHLEQSEGQRT
jgi:hypothetical protein